MADYTLVQPGPTIQQAINIALQIQSLLNQEIARAMAAEAQLASKSQLQAETSRAQGVEATLATSSALEAETARAVAAENAIRTIAESVVNDLQFYYTKSETYSKSEVDNLVSTIPIFDIQVVDALPTTDISETTLYLLRTTSQGDTIYVEYIYQDGAWINLGQQSFNLDDYVRWDETSPITNDEIDAICV